MKKKILILIAIVMILTFGILPVFKVDSVKADSSILAWGKNITNIVNYKSGVGTTKTYIAMFDTGYPKGVTNVNTSYRKDLTSTIEIDGSDTDGHATIIAKGISELITGTNIEIIPIKLATVKDDFKINNYIEGLKYVYNLIKDNNVNIKVINMALATTENLTTDQKNTINDLYGKLKNYNCFVCHTAGDYLEKTENIFPANIKTDNSITVAGVQLLGDNEVITDIKRTKQDYKIKNISFGEEIDIVAPTEVVSNDGESQTYATTYVSSAIALMSLKGEQSANIIPKLTANAIDLGSIGKDDTYGYGLLNLEDINKLTLTDSVNAQINYSDGVYSIELSCTNSNMDIYYTLGTTLSNEPTLYTAPINITANTFITMVGYIKNNSVITSKTKIKIEKMVFNISDIDYLFELEEVDNETYIKKYNGKQQEVSEDIIVPETISGKTIKGISAYAFEGTILTAVTIAKSVIVEDYAFANNPKLTNITFSEDSNLGKAVFINCISLTTISETKFLEIGEYCFVNCINIGENLELNGAITELSAYSFYNCQSIKTINLNNIRKINKYAFYNNISMESISGNELSIIYDYVFMNCENLSSIDITKMSYIGIGSFINTKLVSITLDSMESISMQAFKGIETLTNVSFANVVSIGAQAFEDCKNLETVYIPNCVTLGNRAFAGDINLSNITMERVTNISFEAFSNCRNITQIDLTFVKSIGSCAFEGCSGLTTIKMNNIQRVLSKGFANCENLEYVYFYSSAVEEISPTVFLNCDNLKYNGCIYLYKNTAVEYYVKANDFNYEYLDYISLLNYEKINNNTEIKIIGIMANTEENIILPSKIENLPVTQIGANAFKDTTNIKYVTLTELKQVDESAFANSNLISFYAPNIETIGNECFNNCTQLIDVDVRYVNSLGDMAFCNCDNLKEIIIENNQGVFGENCLGTKLNLDNSYEVIENFVVYSYETLNKDSNIEIYVSGIINLTMKPLKREFRYEENWGGYFLYYPDYSKFISLVYDELNPSIIIDINGKESLEGGIILPDYIEVNNTTYPITTLSNGLFAYTSITSIDLPSTITTIGDEVFAYCEKLKNVNIDNVTNIGKNAFLNCGLLESVTLNSEILELPNGVFEGCASLKNIENTNQLIVIGDNAFKFCSDLYNIDIENVEILGNYAMANCSSITTLNLPNLLEMGEGVFYNTISLNNINLGNISIIPKLSFCNTISLHSFVSDNITTIENNAFEGSYLTEIKLNSLNYLGEGAFKDNINLTICEIPNVLVINDYTFYNCYKLEYITLSQDLTIIGNYAFYNTNIDNILLTKLTIIGNYAFAQCEHLKEVSILSTLNVIGDNIFDNCSRLTSVELHTEINLGANTFNGCENLTTVKLTTNNIANELLSNKPNLTNVNIKSKLITKEMFVGCNNITNLTITAEEIKDSAFINLLSIKNLVLNVDIVGIRAFSNCKNIENIDLINVKNIKNYAFSGIKLVNKIELPNIEYILPNAFNNNNLEKVYIGTKLSNIENISSNAFNNDSIVIYCYDNSVAKLFAQNNNYNYVLLDGISGSKVNITKNGETISGDITSYLGDTINFTTDYTGYGIEYKWYKSTDNTFDKKELISTENCVEFKTNEYGTYYYKLIIESIYSPTIELAPIQLTVIENTTKLNITITNNNENSGTYIAKWSLDGENGEVNNEVQYGSKLIITLLPNENYYSIVNNIITNEYVIDYVTSDIVIDINFISGNIHTLTLYNKITNEIIKINNENTIVITENRYTLPQMNNFEINGKTYRFDCWTDNENNVMDTDLYVTEDLILYANYIEIFDIIINYDTETSLINCESNLIVDSGETIKIIIKRNDTIYSKEFTFTINEDTIINLSTIDYYYTDGETDVLYLTKFIEKGEIIENILPDNRYIINNEEYIFNKWLIGDVELSSTTIATQNYVKVTSEAKERYTLTIQNNGGSYQILKDNKVIDDTIRLNYGDKIDLIANADNYIREILVNGENKVSQLTKKITIEQIEILGNTTISIKCVDQYIITFINEGNLFETHIIYSDDNVISNVNIPTKEEDNTYTYTFKNWIDSEENEITDYTFTESLTLYATYTPIYKEYKITISADIEKTNKFYINSEGITEINLHYDDTFIIYAEGKYGYTLGYFDINGIQIEQDYNENRIPLFQKTLLVNSDIIENGEIVVTAIMKTTSSNEGTYRAVFTDYSGKTICVEYITIPNNKYIILNESNYTRLTTRQSDDYYDYEFIGFKNIDSQNDIDISVNDINEENGEYYLTYLLNEDITFEAVYQASDRVFYIDINLDSANNIIYYENLILEEINEDKTYYKLSYTYGSDIVLSISDSELNIYDITINGEKLIEKPEYETLYNLSLDSTLDYNISVTFRKLYTVTFINDDSEYIKIETFDIVDKPINPTKESVETKTFNFKYWVDENGEEYNFNTVLTENITLEAMYEENTRYYEIKIKFFENGNEITEDITNYITITDYNGGEIKKTTTIQKLYNDEYKLKLITSNNYNAYFNGDMLEYGETIKEFTVTENIDININFEKVEVTFVVSYYYNGEPIILSNGEMYEVVNDGRYPNYIPNMDTYLSSKSYIYKFERWVIDGTKLTAEEIKTYQITKDTKFYAEISYINYENVETLNTRCHFTLLQDKEKMNVDLSIDTGYKFKAIYLNNEQLTEYEINGKFIAFEIDREITKIEIECEEITYNVTFITPKYTYEFIWHATQYPYISNEDVNSINLEKDMTTEHTYEFIGFNNEEYSLENIQYREITQDTIYTAIYRESVRQYNIILDNFAGAGELKILDTTNNSERIFNSQEKFIYYYGTNLILTITPADHYKINRVVIDRQDKEINTPKRTTTYEVTVNGEIRCDIELIIEYIVNINGIEYIVNNTNSTYKSQIGDIEPTKDSTAEYNYRFIGYSHYLYSNSNVVDDKSQVQDDIISVDSIIRDNATLYPIFERVRRNYELTIYNQSGMLIAKFTLPYGTNIKDVFNNISKYIDYLNAFGNNTDRNNFAEQVKIQNLSIDGDKYDYAFVGWGNSPYMLEEKNISSSMLLTSDTIIENNIELYPQFSKTLKRLTVVGITNGSGSIDISNTIVNYDTIVKVTVNTNNSIISSIKVNGILKSITNKTKQSFDLLISENTTIEVEFKDLRTIIVVIAIITGLILIFLTGLITALVVKSKMSKTKKYATINNYQGYASINGYQNYGSQGQVTNESNQNNENIENQDIVTDEKTQPNTTNSNKKEIFGIKVTNQTITDEEDTPRNSTFIGLSENSLNMQNEITQSQQNEQNQLEDITTNNEITNIEKQENETQTNAGYNQLENIDVVTNQKIDSTEKGKSEEAENQKDDIKEEKETQKTNTKVKILDKLNNLMNEEPKKEEQNEVEEVRVVSEEVKSKIKAFNKLNQMKDITDTEIKADEEKIVQEPQAKPTQMPKRNFGLASTKIQQENTTKQDQANSKTNLEFEQKTGQNKSQTVQQIQRPKTSLGLSGGINKPSKTDNKDK